ncbi:MAG: hypothetical protein ACLQLC_15235 [Candidatus Sulfotelmatobacter sp.]
MTSSTDESKTNMLPDPELNPLLNPLLAAHMGRWAEVYFTNPPEKRGEAVAELLRELEKTSAPVSSSQHATDPPRAQAEADAWSQEQAPPTTASKSWLHASGFETSAVGPSTLETSVFETAPQETPAFEKPGIQPATPKALEFHHTCAVCSYVNPPGQIFCGMCGTRLETAMGLAPAVAGTAAISKQSDNEPERAVDHNSVEDYFSDYAIAPAPVLASQPTQFPEPSSLPEEVHFPKFGANLEPRPKNYRLYTGIAVAILFVLLMYMAWRGTRVFTASQKPAPPAATPSTAAPPTQPEPLSAGQPPAPALENSKNENPVASEAASATPVSSTPVKEPPKAVASGDHVSEPGSKAQVATNAAGSSSVAVEPSGAADFAMAQKYLNGDSGTGRNASEAVPLLWRAVGKGNLPAALTLSDLYLRGDGVAKNCDQARVLLDSAARKGGKAAADRLRNLQAFGCQ